MPYYIKKLYDEMIRCTPSKGHLQEKHAEIMRDLDDLGAKISGEIITIGGINLRTTPPRVIETIHEVVARRDYDFADDPSTYIMLDIGMNVGITSLYKACDTRFSKIYSFEPLTPTYHLAIQNIDLNPPLKAKIEAFNYGLSDHDEDLVVKFTPDHIMSISSEATFDTCFNENVTYEKIRVKKASEVLGPLIHRHMKSSGDKIFLKIDCEGAEYRIMNDLNDSGLLKHVDVAIIEWHGKGPDPIIEILAKSGFFCFISNINSEWDVGLIKATRTGFKSELL